MPPYLSFLHDPWVESTLATLTPRQQMAQLLHIAGWSNRGQEHEEDLLRLIEHYGIGGIIFFQGTPERQLELTRRYQAASSVPLLISIDAEWGLGMRLDDSLSFPHQIALGAIQNDQLIYDMGRDLGQQCRRMGIHMNFAPCVDVNVEATNPVIGFRSFGSDPQLVARKAKAYMEGLQDAGILAVAKHFPGHGDTAVDSHHDLPTLPHSMVRLEKIEFFPFRQLIRDGVSAIMPGHLRVPAIDNRPHIGGTLSAPLIQDVLKKHLGFEGLVVTDALDMKGVTKHHPPGDIELKAFQAGNHILLFPSDVRVALIRLERALENGEIDLGDLRNRCRHILAVKRWTDAYVEAVPGSAALHEDLHRPESISLISELHAASISWGHLTGVFSSISTVIGFQNVQEGGDELRHHQLSKGAGAALYFLDKLKAKNWTSSLVYSSDTEGIPEVIDQPWVLSIHGLAVKAKDRFGMSEAAIAKLNALIARKPQVIVLFASPYALEHLSGWEEIPVLHAFQGVDAAQDAAAEIALGRKKVIGKLSVEVRH
ncbi:MAG: glycoside hydrolase family 3 [Bacteroidia bacterium]|nr:glycoside hydrolase family 3 [Bacteroidia bacterium]